MRRGQRWTSDRLAEGLGPPTRRPRLLLLCDYQPGNAATVIDHIESIRAWSRYDVYVLPMLGDLPDEIDLEAFDGLVIHYNLVMASSNYLSPLARWRISRFGGVKGAFIQDEYRFVDETVGVMRMLGIRVLFTCVPEDQVHLVYPAASLPDLERTVTVLTGYVPQELLPHPLLPYDQRPIDVGYRARRLAPWLGDLAQEKWLIAERFLADAPEHGLTVDISWQEEDRLYGQAWIDFVSRSKAMLGVESGASVFDFDGSVERQIRAYVADHPDAGYDDLHRRFMADIEGRIRLNQISPRCFEAAALGTLMILYPGHYSGILEAWRHYVPLQKDHSNMTEVVTALRDRSTWERITAQARREVAENPANSFRALAQVLDRGLDLAASADRPGVSPSTFTAIAERNLAASQVRRAGAATRSGRLSPGRFALRLIRVLGPNPTSILQLPKRDTRRLAGLRRALGYGRALSWWLLRPQRILPGHLLAGRSGLLDDLAQLILIQTMGRRAVATRAASPFLVIADRDAHALRIVNRAVGPAAEAVAAESPGDLSWASSVWLDLADEWLIPPGLEGPGRRLDALSNLMRSHPETVRRLLAGQAEW